MSDMNIERCVETVGLGRALDAPTEITGGLLHKMYSVSTTSGKYAIKVLNREIMKKPRALQNTINSEKIAFVLSKDIPVVTSIIVNEKQIQMQDGCYFMVFPWLEGRSVYAPEIGIEHCQIIGDLLGRIHKADIRMEGIEPGEDETSFCDWKSILEIASKTANGETEWYAYLKKSFDDIIRWDSNANDAFAYLKTKRVISHRDLDPKNVMWNGLQPYLIDWEAAGYVNPYQELLEVINYWATDERGQLQKEYFDVIVDAYKSHVCTDHVDWDHVFSGSFSGMLGWLEYNARRAAGLSITDTKEAVVGQQQLINTIRELYAYQEKLELIREWL